MVDEIEGRGWALRGRHRLSRRALIAAIAVVFTGALIAAVLGGDGDDDTVTAVSVTPPTFFFEGSGSSFPLTTVPPAPQCSDVQLSATVTTDKASYRPGETVKASASLRNNSAGPCYYASYTVSNIWRGPEGAEVRPRQALVADAFRYVSVEPGEEFTRSDEWDQCVSVTPGKPCSAAVPGNYSVTMSWQFSGTPIAATASFELTAAAAP